MDEAISLKSSSIFSDSAADKAERVKFLRNKFNMTQVQFAEEFDIPLGTLRDWEQCTRPDSIGIKFFIAWLELAMMVAREKTSCNEQNSTAQNLTVNRAP